MAKRATAGDEARTNVNPDDEAAYFNELIEFEGRMARIKQAMGTAQARYEKMGVNVKGVKIAVRLAKTDDAQIQHRRNTETFIRLGIITVEADGQGSFIQGLKVAMPGPAAVKGIALARAHADGYNSGRAGAKIDNCQFAPGSEEFVTWRDGFDDGHRDLLLRKPDADKITEASPRRRGRPPGARNKESVEEPTKPGPSTLSSSPRPRGRPKKIASADTDEIGEVIGNA